MRTQHEMIYVALLVCNLGSTEDRFKTASFKWGKYGYGFVQVRSGTLSHPRDIRFSSAIGRNTIIGSSEAIDAKYLIL